MLWNINDTLLATLRAKGAVGRCEIVPSDFAWTVVRDSQGQHFGCRPRTHRTLAGTTQTYEVTRQEAPAVAEAPVVAEVMLETA